MVSLINNCFNLSLILAMSFLLNFICPSFICGQEKLPEGEVLKYANPKESTILMTVKLSNKYKPSYQPIIINLIFWEFSKNPEKHSFGISEKYKEVKDSFNEYLIKIGLPSGNLKFAEIIARSGIFPVSGSFVVPMYTNITVPNNKIIYLGHLEAIVVEKTSDDQLRAGFVLPLLDQAVTGASGGTFKIEIKDNYEEDIPKFIEKYSNLKGVEIEKLIMTQWKQPNKEDMEPPIFKKNPWEN